MANEVLVTAMTPSPVLLLAATLMFSPVWGRHCCSAARPGGAPCTAAAAQSSPGSLAVNTLYKVTTVGTHRVTPHTVIEKVTTISSQNCFYFGFVNTSLFIMWNKYKVTNIFWGAYKVTAKIIIHPLQ